MASTLITVVPVLDGTNFTAWAPKMKNYLMFQGWWDQVEEGIISRPNEAAASTDEKVKKEALQAIKEWDKVDGMAMGAIGMRLTPNIANAIKDETCAGSVWDTLKKVYGQPGLPVIYSDFKKALQFRLSGSDPRPETAEIRLLLDWLHENKVEVPKFIKAMILISVIPKKWDTIVTLILQETDLKKITFDLVVNKIIAEHERTTNSGNLNKFSAIKRKGKNPQYNQQRQQKPPAPADASKPYQPSTSNQQGQKKRGKCWTCDKSHDQSRDLCHVTSHLSKSRDPSHDRSRDTSRDSF